MSFCKRSTEPSVVLARAIAKLAHHGQQDKRGYDCFTGHVRPVAQSVRADAIEVAYLHDVIEDSWLEASDLLDLGVSKDVVYSVVLLTRKESQTYKEYIETLIKSNDSVACHVKIADVGHHLQHKAYIEQSLIERYEKTMKFLAKASERRFYD